MHHNKTSMATRPPNTDNMIIELVSILNLKDNVIFKFFEPVQVDIDNLEISNMIIFAQNCSTRSVKLCQVRYRCCPEKVYDITFAQFSNYIYLC